MDLSAAVIGHSFVRRLRQDLLAKHKATNTGKRQFKPSSVVLAEGLGVASAFSDLHIEGTDIVFVADLYKAQKALSDVQVAAVVIDIGSNDLAHIDYHNPRLILEIATKVVDFAKAFDAQCAAINAILPRTGGITCDASVFVENMDLYNTVVNDLCVSTDKLFFNRMRGFCQTVLSPSATLSERNTPPRLVDSWSSDGIHCDLPDSMALYQKRMKYTLFDLALAL